MKKHWTGALALLAAMALFTLGAAHGNPRPEYSPSATERAWLNPSYVYHPDEFAYAGIGYRLLVKHEWNPHYFHNPSLNIYTYMGLFWATGAQNLPHDVAYGDREIAPFALYVMARYLSALFTLLTVALTCAAGRIAFGRRTGALAAALVAVSPLTVQHAHYAAPNAETTMLATAALVAALMIVKDRYSRRAPMWAIYGLAGLLVGLTMSARYNAAVIGMITGLALIAAWRKHRRWLPVMLGFGLMPVGFALGTPAILFATREVTDQIRDILDWYQQVGGGPGLTANTSRALAYHWRYAALIVVGPGALLGAVLGLGLALRGWRSPRWQDAWIGAALLAYLVVYTALALRGRRIQANLLFPLIAPLALLAAHGAVWCWRRWPSAWIRAGILAALLIWPASLSSLLVYRFDTLDTRLRAQAWIYEHVPRQTPTRILGPYNVPLDPLDYRYQQFYRGEITPEQVHDTNAPIIVYSDAVAFLTLRDRALSNDRWIALETGIRDVLENEWIELARFERLPWPGENLAPDDVSYFHQPEIVIYCNPAKCPVE